MGIRNQTNPPAMGGDRGNGGDRTSEGGLARRIFCSIMVLFDTRFNTTPRGGIAARRYYSRPGIVVIPLSFRKFSKILVFLMFGSLTILGNPVFD